MGDWAASVLIGYARMWRIYADSGTRIGVVPLRWVLCMGAPGLVREAGDEDQHVVCEEARGVTLGRGVLDEKHGARTNLPGRPVAGLRCHAGPRQPLSRFSR